MARARPLDIYVMSKGKLLQAGEPAEIYRRPQTLDAARFIGKANLFQCVVLETREGVTSLRLESGGTVCLQAAQSPLTAGTRATLVLRPERMTLAAQEPKDGRNALPASIASRSFLGSIQRFTCISGGQPIIVDGGCEHPAAGDDAWLTWPHDAGRLIVG